MPNTLCIVTAVPRSQKLLLDLRTQTAALWGAINQRGILLPALFVFLWQVRSHPAISGTQTLDKGGMNLGNGAGL